MYPIYAFGSEEQKQRTCPVWPGRADCLLRTHRAARRLGPGEHEDARQTLGKDWILNGAKMWITNGAIAGLAVVWAMTEEGIRGFLVEKGSPGLPPRDRAQILATRLRHRRAVLRQRRVPEENVLPGVVGLKGPLSCLTKPAMASPGGDRAAQPVCRSCSSTRTSGAVRPYAGPQPGHSDSPRRDGAPDHHRAIARAAAGAPEGLRPDDPGARVLAKWNNCRMALDIARDARDMLGGAGISAEYVPIRHMLNLESVITYEGTETIHQLTIGGS